MKKSVGKKICFIGTMLIVAFVLLNVLLTYFWMAPFSTLFYRGQMKEFGDLIEGKNFEENADIKAIIDEIDEINNVKVTIMDGDKNILYTTRNFLEDTSQFWMLCTELFDSNRVKIDDGESVFLTRNKQRRNNKKTIQLIMIQKVGDNRYAVMSRSYQSLQNAMYSAIIFDLLVGILIVFFGWIVVYRFSRKLVIPIQNITATAEKISDLNFDSHIELNGEDEIGQLASSINKMSRQLELNMNQLQEDIEKRKRLVRNLSHEIKSPIAVIMGYADRMKQIIASNPEKAATYCEIISNESVRVDNLVKEMLELSRIDSSMEEINKEQVLIDDFVHDIQCRFRDENLENDINFTLDYEKGQKFFADRNLMERAIYNLLYNAMSHGEGPDLQIQLTAQKIEDYFEFKVFNTGSHIDEDSLSSIWEKFYKVDKVRGRGTKGYGIGLSIVREIIDAHNGYYKVENKENGIEFLISVKC